MGIDYAAWRARTGLNNYRQCQYYRPLPVQWRAARWGVGEVMNDTSLVLQGCIVVVSLTLILEYAFHSWRGCPKGRGRCGKVRCPKLGGGCVPNAEAKGMAGMASGMHLLLQLCVVRVVLALLLIAGDVERNPGPLRKEGLLSPPKSADTCLPTLSQLSAELRDFKHWYLLGLQLNIRKDTLDSIEKSHDNEVRRCVEMIQHWINDSKNPTWGTVHEALRNIGESVLAARLAHKYDIQPCSSSEGDPKSEQSVSVTSKVTPMSITSVHRTVCTSEENLRSELSGVGSVVEERSLVPTSEQLSTKGRSTAVVKPKHLQIIMREQWRVSSYFATIMRRITKILAQHVQLEDLVSFLRFQCHPLNPEALYVDKHILQHTSSVSDIMESLVPDYINYMETGFLEAIVESFEIEEAQVLLHGYHDRYPHLRQLSDMPDPVPDERLDLTRRKRLRVKCDGDFESARANDVKRIRMSIESATGIDHRFVTPAQHSEGSLILTFLIPESVSGIFQELCDEDLEILAESGIVELWIDDVIISDIQNKFPQRMTSSVQSTSVPSAGQTGAVMKGFDSYIEQREEHFTSKEKAHLTGLLNDVPKSKLEEVCTDPFLQQLAPHMTDWRKLAPSFGISELTAVELTNCYPDTDEQRYKAFHEWKKISPGTATYGNLLACLLTHAPFNLVEAALTILTTDVSVQETRTLLQEAYLLPESQPLWPGAPANLQFDRKLGRITEDTPNNEKLEDIDYSSQFETLEQFSSEVETVSIKSFLNSVTEKKGCFFLIKGPPGSGKTTLLQRVCAFWARGFCLRNFTLVLWLGLNTYPSAPPDASLRTLLRYSLPQGSHIDSIEQWVKRHEAEDVLIVIDGVEGEGKSFMINLVLENSLRNATVISTTSSEPILYMDQTQYNLLGLSQEQVLKQVIHHNTSRAEEFLMYISETHTIRALCSSPPYLATVLFVFDSVDTSDLPTTWTQLFTGLLKLLGLSSDIPNAQSRLFARLLRRSTVSDQNTLAILCSKAYAVTSSPSSFDWYDCFTNFCSRITTPYCTMVAPADHCCFTLTLFQHYLCARHLRTLPRKQRMLMLNEGKLPLYVRRFYVGLCSSFKRVKLLLKYPATLITSACISEIPVEGLHDLMSSQLTVKHQWLMTNDIHSILQAVYHSGLPCKLEFYSCCFGPQAMETIMKGLPILPNGGTVRELSLSHANISDSGACVLAEALKVNQGLQKLDLSHNIISDSGACVLAEVLKVKQGLQKLDLSHNIISDSGACVLAEALKVNQGLQKLDLSDNKISDSGACLFAETLKVNQGLQRLDLSRNTISDKGAYVLAAALQVNQSLQELHLYQNKVSDNGSRILTGAFQLDQRLQRLVLEESKTTVKRASAPASLELNLHNSNISDEGAYVLAGALQINKSLQKLDLHYSELSDEGVGVLAGALQINKSLQELDLSLSNISDVGVRALSGALKVNKSLQELNLSWSKISDDGAHALFEALKVNQSLQELDLSMNLISSRGRSALFEAKHKKKNLKINLDNQCI